jgi:hypothetical protein
MNASRFPQNHWCLNGYRAAFAATLTRGDFFAPRIYDSRNTFVDSRPKYVDSEVKDQYTVPKTPQASLGKNAELFAIPFWVLLKHFVSGQHSRAPD